MKRLGQGSFGEVRLAVNIDSKEVVAVKILDKEKLKLQKLDDQLKREVSITKQLKHHNVVRLIEIMATSKHIFLVMEYVSGGELFDEVLVKGHCAAYTYDVILSSAHTW